MSDNNVYCPGCETALQNGRQLNVTEVDAERNLLAASKRYYVTSCAECEETIGGSVAGAN
jgi:RNase P subunit RPR2